MKKHILIIGGEQTGKSYLSSFIKGNNVVKVDGRTFYETTFKSSLGITKNTDCLIIDDLSKVEYLKLFTNDNIIVNQQGLDPFCISPIIIASTNLTLKEIPNYIKEIFFIFKAV